MENDRRTRIRSLVHELNKARKKQAAKIDILCNDIIDAQRSFVAQLQGYSFALDFYEQIVGQTDITKLVYAAAEKLMLSIKGASVAVFLIDCEAEGFELHIASENRAIDFEAGRLEACFNRSLAESICRFNRIANIEDMIGMGLETDLQILNKISAAAVPLCHQGPPAGFVLVYREAENPITAAEVNQLASVSPGLTRSIRACREFSQASQPQQQA